MTPSALRLALRVCCAAAFVATVACSRNNDIYNSYVALPNTGWGTDSLAVFRVNIDDTLSAYDMYFMLRNQSNYAYQNLWLFVDVVAPDGAVARDTVDCVLAHHDGRWIGSGWGSLYDSQHQYRLNTRFAKAGTYRFRICHGMRDDAIEGIHSIGLRIAPTQHTPQ